jgi:hypothetical protein
MKKSLIPRLLHAESRTVFRLDKVLARHSFCIPREFFFPDEDDSVIMNGGSGPEPDPRSGSSIYRIVPPCVRVLVKRVLAVSVAMALAQQIRAQESTEIAHAQMPLDSLRDLSCSLAASGEGCCLLAAWLSYRRQPAN